MHSTVARTQGRGKIEHFFGTVTTELLPQLPGQLVRGRPVSSARLTLPEATPPSAGGSPAPTTSVHSQTGQAPQLHPAVRAFVLVVLPQLLRAPAAAAGYALQPASTQPRTARALMDTLNLAAMPTAGHAVAADLEQVTLDLAPVPLEEVLDFRQQHGEQHPPTPATTGSSSTTPPHSTGTTSSRPTWTGAKPSPTPPTS